MASLLDCFRWRFGGACKFGVDEHMLADRQYFAVCLIEKAMDLLACLIHVLVGSKYCAVARVIRQSIVMVRDPVHEAIQHVKLLRRPIHGSGVLEHYASTSWRECLPCSTDNCTTEYPNQFAGLLASLLPRTGAIRFALWSRVLRLEGCDHRRKDLPSRRLGHFGCVFGHWA